VTLVTRRTSWRIAIAAAIITALAGLAMVSPTGAASNRGSLRGGSGVITTYGVGSQRFKVAHPASIRAFAGNPTSVSYENKQGQTTSRRHAVWQIWTYQHSGGGYVNYSFHRTRGSWVFVQIDTNRKQFKTARGTRVGMSYAEAKRREHAPYIHGCLDSGFWHFRDQHRYAVIVGVNPGQSVHALHAYGPGNPVC
jgi:hypothetical protein